MKTLSLLGTTLGLGVTSGLNLYATVFGTGLAIRLGWVHLAPGLETLQWLASPAVLIISGLLYLVEFTADKIPLVDHLWDVIHTFIRPLGATLIAWKAIGGGIGEGPEALLILLAGGASLAAHAGKSGVRLAASSSGGHAFGMGIMLSAVEDILAFVMAPLAASHPRAALVGAVVLLACFSILAPMGFRFLRSRFGYVRYGIRHKLLDSKKETLARADLPFRVAHAFDDAEVDLSGSMLILPACAVGMRGIPRWSRGFVALRQDCFTFVRLGWLRTSTVSLAWRDGSSALASRSLGHQLRYDTAKRRVVLAFFPLTSKMARRLSSEVPAGQRNYRQQSSAPLPVATD